MTARRWVGLVLGLVVLLAVVFVVYALIAGNGTDRSAGKAPPALGAAPAGSAVERGRYVATAADCIACHTVPGGQPYAGGVPFKLPFGTIYSTNITPDRDTGIGSWSDEDFVNALQHGVAKGGRQLYPAFPYTSYAGMSRDDALAIKAYLFSLPPVHAPERHNDLSFPFTQRWAIRFWNALFLDDDRFEADPEKPPQWNRGAYLANVLGHCGECHTPRNLAYGLKQGDRFGGETLVGWKAYNISADKQDGIGNWSDQALAQYLSTGHAPGHGAATGPMGEAVAYSLSKLTPEDIGALVAYLRTVEPQSGGPGGPVVANPPALTQAGWGPGEHDPGLQQQAQASGSGPTETLGRRVFEGACESCHDWDGSGRQTPYAALRGDRSVSDPEGTNLSMVVLAGASMHVPGDLVYMPSFGAAYSDAELAAVCNYVIARFGGKQGQVTPQDIAERRKLATSSH